MKNNVIINGRFLTRPLSGVQRTAYELVKALDDLLEQKILDVMEVTFTVLYSGEIVNPISLKHIRLVKRGYLTGNLWEQFELPIYSRGALLISMCSISTLFKKNQMLIVHDASFAVNKHFFSRSFVLWYSFAIPFIAKKCRQIITVSEFSKNELVRHLGIKAEKITVIYNSADHILKFNDPSKAFINKINALKPYCLAVSNLAENKNFSGLNSAIKKIDFKQYHMLIAGGGMRTLKFVTPNENATYLGYVADEELKYLYSQASLFIFPSFYEGFGIPPLEAMISGCPVVASNTSSIPEVLGDASLYFDPTDADDMAHKIDKLINDDDKMKRLKRLGYERAAKYSWQKSAKELTSLISKHNA